MRTSWGMRERGSHNLERIIEDGDRVRFAYKDEIVLVAWIEEQDGSVRAWLARIHLSMDGPNPTPR
jgi:hypothetical protein